MPSIVVATVRPLLSLSDGYDLRVFHLCKALRQAGYSMAQIIIPLFPVDGLAPPDRSIDPSEVFDEIIRVEPSGFDHLSALRHLRWNELDYLRLANRPFLDDSLLNMDRLIRRRNAGRLLFFNSSLGGIARMFRQYPSVFDIGDSVVLTKERELAVSANSSLAAQFKVTLDLWRWRRAEAAIPSFSTQVVTINDADGATVRRLSRGAENIITIPNGVSLRLEDWSPRQGPKRRGVVFWGNLGFGPNAGAVRYFHDAVHSRELAGSGVEWCIIGGQPEDWLLQRAKADASLRVTGFVPDVFPVASEYPVMVNPMISGSGLKNKVLEAFALGLAVVSTPLGMEAIAGAVPGQHYLAADTPQKFAAQIKTLLRDDMLRISIGERARRLVLDRYTWKVVGEQWRLMVEST